MNPITYHLFFSTLGLGTMITFISSHWLLAWVGLEINTLAIIPLMARHHHPRASEAATKYFLTQAYASAILLFATVLNWSSMEQWDIMHMTDPLSVTLVTVALAMKLGLVPLHFWLPEVMQGIDLTTGLILATWQKLAPFALLLQINHNIPPFTLILLGLISAWVASWAGLDQTQMRKILAYSSISHLGWMVVIMQFAPAMALFSLMIYILMTTAAFLTLKEASSTKISILSISWSKNSFMVAMLAMVLLSSAGLPPFTGFAPKIYMLEELTKQGMSVPATLLAASTLISLYYYLRLYYFSTISLFPGTSKSKIRWHRNKKQNKTLLAAVAIAAISFLPLAPFIYVMTQLLLN
nr:NADH dehydrogenase subunit 2 [Hyphessobrycon elachys]